MLRTFKLEQWSFFFPVLNGPTEGSLVDNVEKSVLWSDVEECFWSQEKVTRAEC